MIPTILNYPHIQWRELVVWIAKDMNGASFYYVDNCLNTYIADSNGWYDTATTLKVYAPSTYYPNTMTNAIAPSLKKFFNEYIQSPLSYFYVDTD